MAEPFPKHVFEKCLFVRFFGVDKEMQYTVCRMKECYFKKKHLRTWRTNTQTYFFMERTKEREKERKK